MESYIILPPPNLITGEDSAGLEISSEEMNELNYLSEKFVYNATTSYFKNQNMPDTVAKEQAKKAQQSLLAIMRAPVSGSGECLRRCRSSPCHAPGFRPLCPQSLRHPLP